MNLRSVGIDIIEFESLRDLEKKPKVLKTLFTPRELRYCKKAKNAVPYLAARFAAKEAVIKALGTLGKNVFFSDIEIVKAPNGSVRVVLKRFKNISVMISLSHGKRSAVAVAFAEIKGGRL